MRWYCRQLLYVFFVVFLFGSPSARATTSNFNAIFFQPATGRNDYFMLQGTRTLYQFQFDAGEVFTYGYHPFEVRDPATNRRLQGVIDHDVVAHFVAAFGAFDFLQLGVNLPFFVINEFQSPAVVPGPGAKNQMSLGDLVVEVKARLLNPVTSPVGIAVVPFMTVPIGKESQYVGDSSITGGLKAVVEGNVMRRLTLTANVGYQGGERVLFRNIDYQHRFLGGVGANIWITRELSAFGEANANAAVNKFFDDRDLTPAEGIAGVKYDIGDSGVTIRAAGGSCIVCGVGGARIRGVLGASYRYTTAKLVQRDRDALHIRDSRFNKQLTPEAFYTLKENCPPDPAQYQQGVNDEACPKYYELAEISNLYFRCPPPDKFVPGRDDESCQKVFELGENYSENEIMNIFTLSSAEMGTRCPANPADFNPQIHDLGCPKYYDLSDAVALASVCPATAAAYRAGVDDPGCPKYFELRETYAEDQWAVLAKLSKQDTDGDGINDFKDQCPTVPEDIDGFADEDGCPDGGVATLSGGEILSLQPVYFDFNRAVLKPDAMKVIDQVIAVINQHQWVRRVRIGGHADERGTRDANIEISERRARAVIDYMRRHGVHPHVELVPIAYGALRPISPGMTEAARAKNRRVVFNVVTDVYGLAPLSTAPVSEPVVESPTPTAAPTTPTVKPKPARKKPVTLQKAPPAVPAIPEAPASLPPLRPTPAPVTPPPVQPTEPAPVASPPPAPPPVVKPQAVSPPLTLPPPSSPTPPSPPPPPSGP